jgi:hypothetical protein
MGSSVVFGFQTFCPIEDDIFVLMTKKDGSNETFAYSNPRQSRKK